MSDLGNIITDTTIIDEGPRGLIPRDYSEIGHGSLPYAAPMDMPVMTRKEIVGGSECGKRTVRPCGSSVATKG